MPTGGGKAPRNVNRGRARRAGIGKASVKESSKRNQMGGHGEAGDAKGLQAKPERQGAIGKDDNKRDAGGIGEAGYRGNPPC